MMHDRDGLSTLVEQGASALSVRLSSGAAHVGVAMVSLSDAHLTQVLEHTVSRVLTRDQFLKSDGMANSRVEASLRRPAGS